MAAITGSVVYKVLELQWGDRRTYLTKRRFDLIVAADVLYGGRDGWLARALSAHMSQDTTAYVAIPPRRDSPLAGFFSTLTEQGFQFERLEDEVDEPLGLTKGAHIVFSSHWM